MKFVNIILFFLLLVKLTISELVGVIELVRHGARSTFSFPDKASQLLIDTQKAQLTINGFRQHQILGKILRKNYVEKHKLISGDYNEKEIEIFSTPTERTIFSATAQLSGLFPNNIIKINQADDPKLRNDDRPPFEADFEEIDKKEVQLNINSEKKDLIFRPLKCRLPNSTNVLKSQFEKKSLFAFNKNETKTHIDEIKKIIPELFKFKSKADCEGKPRVKDIYTEDSIGDFIKFIIPVNYHFHDKKYLFSEATEEFLRKRVLNKWYSPRISQNHVVKLSVSGFFDEFINFFDRIAKNQNDTTKMKLYFGHDTNIVNFISILFDKEFLKEKIKSAVKNLTDYNFIVPQFASSFIFELHFNKEKNVHYVKILYNGKEIKENLFELQYDQNLQGIPFESFKSGLNSKIDMRYKDLNCHIPTIKKTLKGMADRNSGSPSNTKKIDVEAEDDDDEKDVKEYLEINVLKKNMKIKKFMSSINLSS